VKGYGVAKVGWMVGHTQFPSSRHSNTWSRRIRPWLYIFLTLGENPNVVLGEEGSVGNGKLGRIYVAGCCCCCCCCCFFFSHSAQLGLQEDFKSQDHIQLPGIVGEERFRKTQHVGGPRIWDLGKMSVFGSRYSVSLGSLLCVLVSGISLPDRRRYWYLAFPNSSSSA